MIVLPLYVAEISQRLSVIRVQSQLLLKLLFGIVILLRLPVEIAEPEVNVGLVGRDFGSSLELCDCFGATAQAVEGLSHEDVRGGRIWILLQQHAKLLESTVCLLGPQAALGEHLMKLGVVRVSLGGSFEV